MQRAVSSQASHEILYEKLKSATASLRIAEDRAERAERAAEHALRTCSADLETATIALDASNVARRHAEERLRVAAQPDPVAQARVRALEMEAHAARKTARECDDESAREALEEVATFQTSVARQARFCLTDGTEPKVVCAHVFVTSTGAVDSASDDAHGDLARLELNVALGRALDASRTATGIAASTHGGAGASAHDRTVRYVQAVSKDLRQGMACESTAYAAARTAGDLAVAR